MTAGVDYNAPGTPDSTFTYKDAGGIPDPLGRLLSRTDPIGTTTYSYKPLAAVNGAGQLYKENGPLADDTLRRDYDWQGSQNSRQVRSDAGIVLHSESFLTDSLGRLTQSTNELGTFTAGYIPGNLSANMNTWSRPNGLNTQFDWYPASAGASALGLQQIHHSQAGATVSKFGYGYDLAGRIQTWTRQLDPAVANQKGWSLAYSRTGELTGVVEKNASAVETSRASWSYDPAGNWYATGDSTATTHRTHDSMNRLNQIGGAGKTVVEGTLNEPANVTVSGQPAQVSSLPGTSDFKFQKEIPVTQGSNNFQITATDARGNARTQNYSVQVGSAQKSYEYDSNGNLLREKDPVGTVLRTFEWDAADRLKAINSGSQRVEWTYNGLGQKVLETTNGTASKRYLWDGASLLLERTPVSAITKRLYGDGEQRVGGPDAGNYYYTRDHLGSVREVVNQAGALQARYDYDAYGKRSTLYQNSAYLNGCIFGYTGHLTLPSLTHGQSELVLTHFRAYDPQLGRWLSADPIGEKGGMNLYAYCKGNSLNFYDPDGRDAYPTGDGWYNFRVNPDHWSRVNPDGPPWTLKDVFNQMNGRRVNHPNPNYTGQCATGAQAMTSAPSNDGRWRDAAPGSLKNWRAGPSVASGSIVPGTMIARGWDGNGNYAGANGHTGIYMGMVNGQHVMIAQNSPHGSNLDSEGIDPSSFFEVRSKVPYSKEASECSTP